jgi:hypothetical protein
MVASAAPAQPSSSFLRNMGVALGSTMHRERELTLAVGVMSAAGLTRAEINKQARTRFPGIEDVDIKAAMLRLRRIAEDL